MPSALTCRSRFLTPVALANPRTNGGLTLKMVASIAARLSRHDLRTKRASLAVSGMFAVLFIGSAAV